MKVINYMNFVRKSEPRSADWEAAERMLFETTVRELEIAKKHDIACTFLIEYDALIDEKYIELFKNEDYDKMELGLWYEIPKQLLDSVGLPWRGREGWTWDWHIIPGFSMAYTIKERETLIDAAMEKFKEIFGFFPKSVASWLIDSHTVNYLSEKYGVDYIGICRDQTCTDAYTLIGGYFNGAYYPSKNNMFTPAQTKENQTDTPVFRLLGPDAVHNYDNEKYLACQEDRAVVYSLEPAWTTARKKDIVKWYDKTFYKNECLNFAYSQIGQENSFFEVGEKMFEALEMQLEVFKSNPDIRFLTTGETGKLFKESFSETPACCVYASEDWSNGEKVQSLYYDCKRYMANLFRFENRIFFRAIYLFDENVEDIYLVDPCQKVEEAVYENLPVCDTLLWKNNNGLTLDEEAEKFEVRKIDDKTLTAFWSDKKVTFSQDGIVLTNIAPSLDISSSNAKISIQNETLKYEKDGASYCLKVLGSQIDLKDNKVEFSKADEIKLLF